MGFSQNLRLLIVVGPPHMRALYTTFSPSLMSLIWRHKNTARCDMRTKPHLELRRNTASFKHKSDESKLSDVSIRTCWPTGYMYAQ